MEENTQFLKIAYCFDKDLFNIGDLLQITNKYSSDVNEIEYGIVKNVTNFELELIMANCNNLSETIIRTIIADEIEQGFIELKFIKNKIIKKGDN